MLRKLYKHRLTVHCHTIRRGGEWGSSQQSGRLEVPKKGKRTTQDICWIKLTVTDFFSCWSCLLIFLFSLPQTLRKLRCVFVFAIVCMFSPQVFSLTFLRRSHVSCRYLPPLMSLLILFFLLLSFFLFSCSSYFYVFGFSQRVADLLPPEELCQPTLASWWNGASLKGFSYLFNLSLFIPSLLFYPLLRLDSTRTLRLSAPHVYT